MRGSRWTSKSGVRGRDGPRSEYRHRQGGTRQVRSSVRYGGEVVGGVKPAADGGRPEYVYETIRKGEL